ncbi:S-adenosyl-L-methionine-dependent methyltransferase [Leptospira langatensis]|uniref:S-adenosyl-L-methionine-dependent methyltransferase n=1 Tax=Leptospira langatensis TaxID=2484983 RepID=A0A5F1ZRR0_9LEPT|nr:SAM-dependent methyltransferase [Leptospira langatensis]TGK02621.1 S-adenosyl-L-methionine-dependent methyltransferase [Leptospira langatensis]TGL40177.1 S-adenosyl-L-methionine-dependent methyltransferase [Leptospira langatensis]
MPKSTYTILESNARLSESKIWEYQRTYFEQRGHGAWLEGEVPFYSTSNSFIAGRYAELLLSIFEDKGHKKQKFKIIEIGGGTGKFAHLTLCALEQICPELLAEKNIQYILTDLTSTNVGEYAKHSSLQKWIEAEILSLAICDIEKDENIRLTNGSILQNESDFLHIFIANYVFDGVPQDLFEIENQGLREVRITTVHQESIWNELDAYNLGRIQIRLDERIQNDEPYSDPSWNKILREYQEQINNLFLSFPTTAIRCLDRFSTIFTDSIFFICDKGTPKIEDLTLSAAQTPVEHGSISMPVNFHCLGLWARDKSWMVLEDIEERDFLRLNIYTPIGSKLSFLPKEYARSQRNFSIDDFIHLRRSWEKLNEDIPLQETIACLKVCNWDTKVFLMFYDKILPQFDSSQISSVQTEILSEGMRILRKKNFFDTEEDLSFCIGILFARLGKLSEAISCFRESIAHYGENPYTQFNLAVCLFDSEHKEEAFEILREVRSKHPDLPIPFPLPKEMDFETFSNEQVIQGK